MTVNRGLLLRPTDELISVMLFHRLIYCIIYSMFIQTFHLL
jgi:hypothetical protein